MRQSRRPSVGVERVVAQKFEDAAVKSIGSRLDAGVDDAALVIAKLRRGVLGDDVEFLDSVDARLVADFVVGVFAVDDAIEQKLIGLLAVAIDVWPAGTGHALRLVQRLRIGRGCARREQRQLNVVARRQRHRHGGIRINHVADLGALGLQDGSGAGHFHGFRLAADLHLEIYVG